MKICHLTQTNSRKQIAAVLVLFVIGLFSNLSIAQSAPAYYRVADLENGDHLNVRAKPEASSDDIGDLAGGSRPYEIIETDSTGKWGKILWLEGTGWVALKYMVPISVELLAKTQVPVGLTCVGTEPFWTIELKTQQSAVISTTDATLPLSVSSAKTSLNQARFPVAIELTSANTTATTVLRRGSCADGMSEITYGWTASVIMQPNFKLLSGCCVLRTE